MTQRPTLASVSDSIIENMDAKEVSGHDTAKNKCKKKKIRCHFWEPKYFTPDGMGVSSLKMLNVLHRAQGVTA